MTNWDIVKHFKPEEWVTQPDMVKPELVYLLDEIRDALGFPIVIHVAYEPTGHSKNSKHYTGEAVDFHIKGISLGEAWLELERWSSIGGLGVYPFWTNPGFHVDIRPTRRKARWWRDLAGKYQPVTPMFVRHMMQKRETWGSFDD